MHHTGEALVVAEEGIVPHPDHFVDHSITAPPGHCWHQYHQQCADAPDMGDGVVTEPLGLPIPFVALVGEQQESER